MHSRIRGDSQRGSGATGEGSRLYDRRRFFSHVGCGVWGVAAAQWLGAEPARAAEPAREDSARPDPLVGESALRMMKELTKRLLEAGKARTQIGKDEYPVYLPSGSGQYPAFWPRDAVWIVHGDLVPADDIGSMVRVMALSQNGSDKRELKHGLLVPAWAIADHILLKGGRGVFFPGTYSAGSDQGTGRYGVVASQDPSYQFIEMAYQWCRKTGETEILKEDIKGIPIIERMKFAFESPEHDPDTQLAHCSKSTRSVAFNDAILQTGFLLQGSVIRWRAARRLAALCQALGARSAADHYRQVAGRIRDHLVPTFWRGEPSGPGGWLLSSTEMGRKDCVRGTCLTLAFGALPEEHAVRASETLAAHSTPPRYKAVPKPGQITYQAHVRHLKAGEFWDETRMAKGHYQNGGYWSMFTGWYLRAVALAVPKTARQQAGLFVEHLRRHNFVNGTEELRGAPWEWIHPRGVQKGPQYLAGLTLPYRACCSTFDIP